MIETAGRRQGLRRPFSDFMATCRTIPAGATVRSNVLAKYALLPDEGYLHQEKPMVGENTAAASSCVRMTRPGAHDEY